jgi:hypothetical protein
MSGSIGNRATALVCAAAVAIGAGALGACGDDEPEETVETSDVVTAPVGPEQADTVQEQSQSLGGAPPENTPQQSGGAESGKTPASK